MMFKFLNWKILLLYIISIINKPFFKLNKIKKRIKNQEIIFKIEIFSNFFEYLSKCFIVCHH